MSDTIESLSNPTLQKLVSDSLSFEYLAGGVTLVPFPSETGWRTLPCAMVSQAHGDCQIALGDGTITEVRAGQGICLPAGVLHNIAPSDQSFISRWSHVNFYLFGSVDLLTLLERPLVLTTETANQIGDINQKLTEINQDSSNIGKILQYQGFGFLLASLLLRCSHFRPDALHLFENAARLLPVLTYLEKNFSEQITVERLAELLYVSVSRFHGLFRATMGVSPGQYLQNLRMRRAQQLLMTSSLAISAIALEVGYGDLFQFSKAFKKSVGISPGRYRDQIRASLGNG